MCQEIGLAAYLDALAGPSHQQVSGGTATVAKILNGLGFSNRRLYLVSQFFVTKPVEHLLGPGITAEMLHDDCGMWVHPLTHAVFNLGKPAERHALG